MLSREELTAALAVRQMLDRRRSLAPAEAIARLTPLQGQEPRAPFVALAARLEGFDRPALEQAIDAREVVKTTIHRATLHLANAGDYPAYHQLTRQARMRTWRNRHPHLDEDRVTAELTEWFDTPRTNDEIRERVVAYEGVEPNPWAPIWFARTLLPLVQLPPAGHWRQRRQMLFEVHPGPLPDAAEASAIVLRRYLAAFGPATRKDVAAWAGVAQRDFAWDAVETIDLGGGLLDLPGQPLPPADTELPVRFLGNWEQPLLAYADRERIIPEEVAPLRLTLSGDQTVTVDGRVAASWRYVKGRVEVTPHVPIAPDKQEQVDAEAERVAGLFS